MVCEAIFESNPTYVMLGCVELWLNWGFDNTSPAAKGALAHCLSIPKWPVGSGKSLIWREPNAIMKGTNNAYEIRL